MSTTAAQVQASAKPQFVFTKGKNVLCFVPGPNKNAPQGVVWDAGGQNAIVARSPTKIRAYLQRCLMTDVRDIGIAIAGATLSRVVGDRRDAVCNVNVSWVRGAKSKRGARPS